jgi:hypothetical protein
MRKGALVFGHIALKASRFVFIQILGSIGPIGGGFALGQKGYIACTLMFTSYKSLLAKFVQLLVM